MFSTTNLPYFDSTIDDLSYFGLWGLYLAPLGMYLPVTYLFTLSHADYVLARTVRDRRDRGHQSVSSLLLQTTCFQRAPDYLSSFSMSLRVLWTLYQLLTPAMGRERLTCHFSRHVPGLVMSATSRAQPLQLHSPCSLVPYHFSATAAHFWTQRDQEILVVSITSRSLTVFNLFFPPPLLFLTTRRFPTSNKLPS